MKTAMDTPTLIDCQDCTFREVVAPDDDMLPAEVLIEHGEETDHKLDIVEEWKSPPTIDSGNSP